MKQELILNDVWTDWLTNGIFQIIDEQYNIPWENDIDSRLLDMEYYGNRSGTKKIAPLLYYLLDQDGITAENKRTLADLCWKKFNKNWSALWNTLNFDYDPISNYDMVETEGTTAASTTDANSGIYGFNSQQASPSDTSHSTTNGNENRTLTRKGNIGVTTSQQMIQSERDLWMWKFYEQLFADVDTVLVTAVFGCSNRDYLTVIAQAAYKLPIASNTVLGGVKPESKTDEMTLSVGVDENGRLWVKSVGDVESVNGKTGVVELNYDDVGAPSLEEFQQIEDDVDMHSDEINALSLKVPFRFGVDGEGNYGYFKADDSFSPFKSGGGGFPDDVKYGELSFPSGAASRTHIISFEDIGFTPRKFFFWLKSGQTITTVNSGGYMCLANEATAFGDRPSRFGVRQASSQWLTYTSTSTLTQESNMLLYVSGNTIRFRGDNAYRMQAGTWCYLAIK